MSKREILKSVQKEIESINRRIDERIVRGLSYGFEARRHKTLLSQLNKLRKDSSGIFGRLGFLSAIF